MKIDEVANSVMKLRRKIRSADPSGDNPKILIYMSMEYFYDCMIEIRGEVPGFAYDFYDKQQIYGYPVFEVAERTGSHKHPPFLVLQG